MENRRGLATETINQQHDCLPAPVFFLTFLLQQNLPQMFALLMEP